MLEIEKLETHFEYMGDSWMALRRGRITASNFGRLIGEQSHDGKFTKGAISYLQDLAAERVTGKKSRSEFRSDATDHGNAQEPYAIEQFCRFTRIPAIRNEERGDARRVIVSCPYSACTPDALLAPEGLDNLFNAEKTAIRICCLEVKCPMVHNKFVTLYECKTPKDLKKANKMYYWQVMDQMISARSLIGYFAAYNESFINKMRIIEFKQKDLLEDVAKAKATKHYAIEEIKKIEQRLLNN